MAKKPRAARRPAAKQTQPKQEANHGAGQLEETQQGTVSDGAAAQGADPAGPQTEATAGTAARDGAGSNAPQGALKQKPIADDQALAAAGSIGDLVMDCLTGNIREYQPSYPMTVAAAFIRKNPDAPAEALVIELNRKRHISQSWADLPNSKRSAWEMFKLALITLDAKLLAMQPEEKARAVLGYTEPAEILADQPGDLTDQAVR